jgi:hypothetical protein
MQPSYSPRSKSRAFWAVRSLFANASPAGASGQDTRMGRLGASAAVNSRSVTSPRARRCGSCWVTVPPASRIRRISRHRGISHACGMYLQPSNKPRTC